ncbi:hypothetical protein lpari_00544 [Legionella parisiensis]|uniref:Uncharacterized protein n=2 Tax=Legionella parisiensis TaxID=45071 RepID=A0A1E5JVC2_9GAMM|nr:hypothetical protein [Legionella parisiensis]OEH48469.1 hypothetical protein lpari_00544 [Legionella parisiensis]
MSRKIHKATAETSKHQPTTEELRSDVIGKNGYQKQMDAGLTLLKNIKGENGFQKRWEALQIAKEK